VRNLWVGSSLLASFLLAVACSAPAQTSPHALNTHGELSLAQLKKLAEGKGPIFEWAIGWLAREGKVVVTRKKRSFSIRLK